VRVLQDGLLPGGWHEVTWNGCDASSRPLSPGVYFVLVEAGADERSVERLVLVR
ncbi:hypothetical protein GX411_01795, partial [Candidatus Fermentibacteria bacterium]|nr:hypothetical protein [Candidatus Fermentibacteria bacterium]